MSGPVTPGEAAGTRRPTAARAGRETLTALAPPLLIALLIGFSAWEAVSHLLMSRLSMSSYHLVSLIVETGMASAMALLALAALRRQNRRLKELMVLREALTQMEVHDLRNPLTAIILSLEVVHARMVPGPEKLRETVELCQDSARRLKGMLEDLLDVARLEETSELLERTPGPFEPLIRESVRILTPAAEAGGVRLVMELAEDLPRGLRDEARLERVMENLLSNAIRHSPRNCTVRVSARVRARGLEVEVADSGPGIADGDRGRVFEKFARLEPSAGRSSFGLGLSFCHLVVTEHGGTLEVDRAPEGGACFRMRLPHD